MYFSIITICGQMHKAAFAGVQTQGRAAHSFFELTRHLSRVREDRGFRTVAVYREGTDLIVLCAGSKCGGHGKKGKARTKRKTPVPLRLPTRRSPRSALGGRAALWHEWVFAATYFSRIAREASAAVYAECILGDGRWGER